jgi:DNA-binding SARP family transcriptional activator
MLTLRTLGGVSLSDESGPLAGAMIQHRRLALLAVLAAAGTRGVSRDRVAALLWPESGPERARHALAQWLFLMRRDLGEDAVAGTGELRLNPTRVASDVAEFDEAVERKAHERAAALYAGPFLDGFFLSNAPEFEHWVDAERAKREAVAGRSFEALARAAAARADHAAAAVWWQRRAALEPLSGRVTLELMQALVDSGDRAAALRHAQQHEALVRRELEVPVEAEVAALVARLRQVGPSANGHGPLSGAQPPRDRRRADATVGRGAAGAYAAHVAEALGSRYAVERMGAQSVLATSLLARRVGDNRTVVLRVLLPAISGTADLPRLLAGLREAARLGHPNLAPILDVGAEGDVVYFATLPHAGETLRERLAREGRIPVADAVRLGRDVAAALAFAHARSVLHLDLTPKRIALTARGALVLDAGIARAILGAATGEGTQTAITLGTPAYMSPELATGESAPDARSDVYSLGCVLYHALAGAPPHAGGSAQATLVRRLTEPAAPLRSVNAAVSESVERVVMIALDRKPAARYRTVQELGDALAGAAGQESGESTRAP